MAQPAPQTAAPASVPAGEPAADDRMARIVRWYGHEMRNHLNVLELEATVLGGDDDDSETAATVRRMRTELTRLDLTLKALLIKFEPPQQVVVAAGDLLRMWRFKVLGFERPGRVIEWSATTETRSLTVNAKAVVSVLGELTFAAWQRASGRPLRASIEVNDADAVVVSLREPAHELSMSGDLLAESTRFIQANGGRLEHGQDSATGEWVTTLTFAAIPEAA